MRALPALRRPRGAVVRTALLLAAPATWAQTPATTGGDTPFGPAQQTSPGAHVCVLCDLGATPDAPRWPKEAGLFAKGPDGHLYSTSPSGGKNGQGTLFKISPYSGALEVLFDFDLTAHGGGPVGGLVPGANNLLYGTTYNGGLIPVKDGAPRRGAGTIFTFDPVSRELHDLHTFRNGALWGMEPEICEKDKPCKFSPQQRLNAAGSYPLSAPVRAKDGTFYGVTSYSGNQKYGMLYKVTPYKSESGITALCIGGTVPTDPDITDAQLRDQCLFNVTNGSYPMTLTPGPDGKLYGVTWGAGNGNLYGTLFRAETSGKVTTLHRFDLKSGANPHSIVVDNDGTIYGTANSGGTLANGKYAAGVVYKYTTAGQYSVLHAFTGVADGASPLAGLTLSREGLKTYLYGTTRGGGQGRGVIYRVSTTGEFEPLHHHPWNWKATGRSPQSTLFELENAFYGTTYQGGRHDAGVIFRLTAPQMRPVPDLVSTLEGGTVAATDSFMLPGETEPTKIEVRTGVSARPNLPNGEKLDDGITIGVDNCRNAHILQFISREKIGVDGHYFAGGYATTNANGDPVLENSYQLTVDPKAPYWHTDAWGGRPNAYYDQNPGVRRIHGPFSLKIFDQPTFVAPIFIKDAHETWRATFRDFVVCNCEVVREVKWTREVRWQVDLSAGPNVIPDMNVGKQLPHAYVEVSIVAPPADALQWANAQLVKDGYYPVP